MIEILGLALAIVTGGYQTVVAEWGASVDKRALTLAKQIAAKISKNNALKEKLTNAYNEKNTSLINSMFRGMGFGPRAEQLAKMKSEEEHKYQKSINDINEKNVELEKAQNQANQASMLGGTSITGNVKGQKALDQIEQNIKGGAYA